MKRLAATCVLFFISTATAQEWYVETHISILGGITHHEPTGGGDASLIFGKDTFRIALAAPIRFGKEGLRKADWDELTDFGRILAEAGYGKEEDVFYIRAGTLSGTTLGTGHLVSRFFSTLDPDHWRSGVVSGVHFPVAGADILLDSFLSPSVIAGRAYVRPFQPLDEDGLFGRIELGFSAGGDIYAPYAYRRLPGTTEAGPIVLTDSGLPEVYTRSILLMGADLRWILIEKETVSVCPYSAWGYNDGSHGIHAGIDLSFGVGRGVKLGIAAEFRRLWAGYIAAYLDTFYVIDRYDLDGLPKLTRADATDDRLGMAASFKADWSDKLTFFGIFDFDQEGRFTSLRTGLNISIEPVKASLLLLEKGLESASAITNPDRLLFATSLDVTVHPMIALFVAYAHDATFGGSKGGLYHSSDTALLGIRFQFRPM